MTKNDHCIGTRVQSNGVRLRNPSRYQSYYLLRHSTRIDDYPMWLLDVITQIDAPEPPIPTLPTEVDNYSVASALEEVFLDKTQLQQILDSISLRKNLILQGPPWCW